MQSCSPTLNIKTSSTVRDPRYVVPDAPVVPALPGRCFGVGVANGVLPTDFDEVSFVATVDGQQMYTLPTNVLKVNGVYINGLRQRWGTYTIVDKLLTMPAILEVVTGDIVSVEVII